MRVTPALLVLGFVALGAGACANRGMYSVTERDGSPGTGGSGSGGEAGRRRG